MKSHIFVLILFEGLESLSFLNMVGFESYAMVNNIQSRKLYFLSFILVLGIFRRYFTC